MARINVEGDGEYNTTPIIGVMAANSVDGEHMVLRFDVPDGPPIMVELCRVAGQVSALYDVLSQAEAEAQEKRQCQPPS